MNGEPIRHGPVFEDCPVLNRVAVAGVIADPRESEFECNPAGQLCQSARFGPFQRTQVDVLDPKFHRSPGQRQSEITDPYMSRVDLWDFARLDVPKYRNSSSSATRFPQVGCERWALHS